MRLSDKKIKSLLENRDRCSLMGVINLSSESFYKNSYCPPEHLPDTIHIQLSEGADIIDIGARSTAPHSPEISVEEEMKRVNQALSLLDASIFEDVPISIDTQYSQVARDALLKGVSMINDVSGLTTDPSLAELVIDFDCPIVLMASFNRPGDHENLDEALLACEQTINRAVALGVPPDKIILDPGIGRWTEKHLPPHDLIMLREFHQFKRFEKPLLAGISRKSFIGEVLGLASEERLYGSLAATIFAVMGGASIIRTHDVAPTRDAVKVAQAIMKGSP